MVTSAPLLGETSAQPGELPPGWRKVRFDQMAENITERVDNPSEAGVECYVGLEHLDPESLRIRRWGTPDEVEATKLRFWPGDIIFGRRRAYQRKLAVADFEGICSAHAMVLRAREETVLPDFLPLFMQSEVFFEQALAISVGSLSPTINWKALAQQQFALPPLDEQRRIADILGAADEAMERYLDTLEEAENAFNTAIHHLMQFGVGGKPTKITNGVSCPAHWDVKSLGQIALVERGRFAHRPRNLPRFYNGPYPFVQTGDVAASRGVLRTFEQTLSEEGKSISRSFKTGSILITIAAVIGGTAITTFEVWCPDSVVGIVPNQNINVYFLEFYLRTRQKYLESKVATQTAQKNINLAVLRPLLIPIPPIEEQNDIARILLAFQDQIYQIGNHITQLREVRKHIVQSLLMPTTH